MYKYFLIAIILCFGLGAMGQNRATLKGKVTDSISKTPIEFATIAVLNAGDTTASSLITYKQSDKDGLFDISSIPANKPLKVVISFVGYKPYIKFFSMIKGQTMDMGDVALSTRLLAGVVIKAERMPIRISKDTVEFDAAAFKVRPNAVVQDLLKKLPGVSIDNQGKISIMGKDVSKVLVDGRKFFANDPRILLKELDAELIAKVQVYDDREGDPHHLKPSSELDKIINLKFKKVLKKSLFGKVYAGQGTNNFYQAGGLINSFRDTLQVSLLGATNNLNNTGFSYEDLSNYAGTGRGGTALQGAAYGTGRQGKQTSTATGININTDYPKTSINLAYLFSHTNTNTETAINRQQFINDTTTISSYLTTGRDRENTHNISATLKWNPDSLNKVEYTPNIIISNSANSNNNDSKALTAMGELINTSASGNNSTGDDLRFEHSADYYKTFKKEGSSLDLHHLLNIGQRNFNSFSTEDLVSNTSAVPSFMLNRMEVNRTRSNTADLSIQYNNKFGKKLSLNFNIAEFYIHEASDNPVYDFDPATGEYRVFVTGLSNQLTRKTWQQNVRPTFKYQISDKLYIESSVEARLQSVNNIFARNAPNLNQHYLSWLPKAELHGDNFHVGYDRDIDLVDISDLMPYSIVYSPMYTYTGNPDLKPTYRDNLSASYYKYDYQNGTNITIGANVTFFRNSVFRSQTVSASLVSSSMPVNRNGQLQFHFQAEYGKELIRKENFQLRSTTSVKFDHRHDFFILNNAEGFQNRYSPHFSERISLDLDGIMELQPGYDLAFTHARYTGITLPTRNVLTHNVNSTFTFYLPKKFNISGTYTYNYNPLVASGLQRHSNLLNVAIAHPFLKKDRAEIKLSCYDLLDQNVNTYRYIEANAVQDIQSQLIRRYFMLRLMWKFNSSKTK